MVSGPHGQAGSRHIGLGEHQLVAELLRTIGGGHRLVALVGASGSGKSSVVRAGLIPALAKGAIEGSDGWLVASMMPGAHPFAELEGALLRTSSMGHRASTGSYAWAMTV